MREVRERGRGRGRGRKGKRKGKEFMDAALDGYIRDQALHKWREVDGLMTGAEIDARQALQDSGDFLERGPYRDLWRRNWLEKFSGVQELAGGTLFAKIEEAVRGAVLEEREERRQGKVQLLEDSLSYKKFIARNMDQLLEEASGEIEELD